MRIFFSNPILDSEVPPCTGLVSLIPMPLEFFFEQKLQRILDAKNCNLKLHVHNYICIYTSTGEGTYLGAA